MARTRGMQNGGWFGGSMEEAGCDETTKVLFLENEEEGG